MQLITHDLVSLSMDTLVNYTRIKMQHQIKKLHKNQITDTSTMVPEIIHMHYIYKVLETHM